jgi:hypothetical protein
MGWTYIAGAITEYATATGTSTAAASTFNLAAGDTVVAWYTWDSGTGGTIGCSDGGSNTFTALAEINSGSHWGCVLTLLAATANATATITATTSNSRPYRSLAVMQFRPDSGETVELDGTQASATGTGTSLASSAISTTGADEIVLGLAHHDNYNNYSALAIGGTAADQSLTQTSPNMLSALWTRILTGTASDITATATQATSSNWACVILAIKSTAATAKFARPSSDVADGNWLNESASNVNLYASIDEVTASDVDYIKSGASPANDTCTVGLGALSTPVSGTTTMRIRAKFL